MPSKQDNDMENKIPNEKPTKPKQAKQKKQPKAKPKAATKGDAKKKTAEKPLPTSENTSNTAQLPVAVPVQDGADLQTEPEPIVFQDKQKSKNFFVRMRRAFGDMLYSLGFAFEYHMINVGRILRTVASFALQILAFVSGRIWGAVKRTAAGFVNDITRPIKRFRRRRVQFARVRARAQARAKQDGVKNKTFFGGRVQNLMQLFVNVAAFVLPVVATIVLVVTVYSVLSMNYALAVEYNGQVLGYVTDQNIVESAKGLLRDRIRVAPNQNSADWQFNPTYTITQTNEYTTTQQLVNEILLSSENADDLVQATGLYVGGTLYAVTEEGERLEAFLDSRLQGYEDIARDGASVQFVEDIVCDPAANDVFFLSSVVEYTDLLQQLNRNVSDEEWYTSTGELTLEEIAHENDLVLDALQARNEDYAQLAGTFIPQEGERLLLRPAQPFLAVQTSYREQSIEPIPYQTITQESAEHLEGTRVVVQQGVEGQQEVWDDYIYRDGLLDRRTRVEELTVVITEPVDEIVEVGTRTELLPSEVTGGGGGFIFPVPGSPYSSRGFIGGGVHRGLDINAPAGTPILAAQGGVVTSAGWHYSWGNYIVIEHPGGISTLYAHCSALYVGAGQQVAQGQNIAAVGSTGNSTGNHLHLELSVNGVLVDPVPYVGYPY